MDEPEVLAVEPACDVRQAFLVEVGEQRGAGDRAPDVPHPAEDDHAEDEDREVEEEVVREDADLERAVPGSGDAAEEGAARVGPRLRPHQRDPHRRSGHLVLADRDPRPAEPRVAKADGAEDRDQKEHDRRPVDEVDEVHERALFFDEVRGQADVRREPAAEPRRVDRVDAERAVREVEVRLVVDERRDPVRVAVQRRLVDDLAEAERDDGEVVTAQPQRRQADQDAGDRGDARADQED